MSVPLRTVLAVLLAAALLTVGLSAADRAHESRTATRLDATTTGLVSAAESLAARNDPTLAATARRTVTIHVPAGGSLGIAGGAVRWQVDGGRWHRRQSTVALDTERPSLDLAAGRHRLRLALRLRAGSPVVLVARIPRT